MVERSGQKARAVRRPERVFWCAFLNVVSYIAMGTGIVTLVMFMAERSTLMAMIALASAMVFVFCRVLAFAMGTRVSCQLCHGPTFQDRHCRKHKGARKYPLMTSRASMMLDIVLRARFFCMYCGTPFRLRR